MIGYVTLGTNDLSKAKVFYDQLLATLGATRMMETERFVAWHTEPGKPGLGITRPSDGQAASVGNGVMVALEANSPEQVDQLHAQALALGGSDEGAPGPRELPGFYAGYFRDLDGNKLNAFCFTAVE